RQVLRLPWRNHDPVRPNYGNPHSWEGQATPKVEPLGKFVRPKLKVPAADIESESGPSPLTKCDRVQDAELPPCHGADKILSPQRSAPAVLGLPVGDRLVRSPVKEAHLGLCLRLADVHRWEKAKTACVQA